VSLIKYAKKIVLTGFSYLPSELKIFSYRCMGAKIGKNVELGIGSIIIPFDYDFKKIHIENGVIIEEGVQISTKNLFLGENSQIKDNTKIRGQSDFTVGKRVYIGHECYFDLRKDISLEDTVTIAAGSWFYTHSVFQSVLDGFPVKFGPITIGERTFVGANAFILPGITIGRNTIVGARTVVSKNIDRDSVVVGNPAREIAKSSQKMKTLSEEEKNSIVLNIIHDFTQVYDKEVQKVLEREHCCVIKINNLHLVYTFRIENTSFIDIVSEKYRRPLTLISFDIPDHVKELCEIKDIFWLDLKTSSRSPHSNTNNQNFERFLTNYGIEIR
jgi:acetyltransferase-like isoleucine patch superfamily enzyme